MNTNVNKGIVTPTKMSQFKDSATHSCLQHIAIKAISYLSENKTRLLYGIDKQSFLLEIYRLIKTNELSNADLSQLGLKKVST